MLKPDMANDVFLFLYVKVMGGGGEFLACKRTR